MLALNAWVIFFALFSTLFMGLSKYTSFKARIPYVLMNGLIVVWEVIPFYTPVGGPVLNILFAWCPLILFLPIFHRETALLTSAFGDRSFDASFISFEKKYFSKVMAFHQQNQGQYKLLSECLHLCYLSFYILIYGVPFYFYMMNDRTAFYATTLAILMVLLSCFMTHAFIPVHGPRNIFDKISDKRSHGLIFRAVHWVLAEGSTPGTAFPSGHTSVACVVALMTAHFHSPIFYYIAPIALGLVVSTIYGRFHYVTDMIFGCIYAIIAFFITCYVYA